MTGAGVGRASSLQFEYYLTRALEEAYKVGQKPVGADMIENVLAKDIVISVAQLTTLPSHPTRMEDLVIASPTRIM
jgi:hypothetical protein